VLFASGRVSAPTPYAKLWTIPVEGGAARQLPAYMGIRGSFSPDGSRIVVDRVDRWDVEFRSYRGGQNTPLTDHHRRRRAETRLPNERTMDVDPVWMGETIYFLSDRDWATNVWAYDVRTARRAPAHPLPRRRRQDARRPTAARSFSSRTATSGCSTRGAASRGASRHRARRLPVGRAALGRRHPLDRARRASAPTASARCSRRAARSSRCRWRRATRATSRAPRAPPTAPPVWSPDGERVAWFSDEGAGYRLLVGDADGLGAPRAIAIGDAKMAWNPAWSPDGAASPSSTTGCAPRGRPSPPGAMVTADTGGASSDRGAMRPAWSPDSRWLAYAKTFPNQFRRVVAWSRDDGRRHTLTDALASAGDPVWDRNGKWLYFLASTDLGVQSGWADLGSLTRTSTSGVYVALLRADEPTPFTPESDEEAAARRDRRAAGAAGHPAGAAPGHADDARPRTCRRCCALPRPPRQSRAVDAGGEERRQAGRGGAKKLGFQVTTGVGKTGVVAVMKNGPGPVLMLRADMDGLPVVEQTGLPSPARSRHERARASRAASCTPAATTRT
jgi:tricorn protease